MKLYIFDFDGTITNYDSFIRFTFFSLSFFKFFKYWLCVLLYLPFKSRGELKEIFYLNFKETDIKYFDSICLRFLEHVLCKTIKNSFIDFLKTANKDSKIVVVSASIKNYLKPWCDSMGLELISTELEVINGKLTGNFSTPNCNGKEKVRRIKEKYNLSKYDEIHVFGNSKGDFPMLSLGTHKYFRFFK
jgi:HAD superfamily phosphoserine phosphatase-like hydrolase